jgi:hypothetical protein
MRSVNPFFPRSPVSLSLALCFAAASAPAVLAQGQADPKLSFFITSVGLGKGGDLGGLAGADAHCRQLAEAVGAGERTWRAYLSTQAMVGAAAVNARDRIGTGPWYNAKGVEVAGDVADLHSPDNKLSKENSLNEKGLVVNGRGDTPNEHDMLTGSHADGTAYAPGADMTCANWTSSSAGKAMLGHHDRHGVAGNIDSTSWNEAHASSGCSQANLVSTGGAGYFYCFAEAEPVGLKAPSADRSSLAGFPMLWEGGEWNQGVTLVESGNAALEAYTLAGARIAAIPLGRLPAGAHTLRWNGRDGAGRSLPRGFYLIRITIR